MKNKLHFCDIYYKISLSICIVIKTDISAFCFIKKKIIFAVEIIFTRKKFSVPGGAEN